MNAVANTINHVKVDTVNETVDKIIALMGEKIEIDDDMMKDFEECRKAILAEIDTIHVPKVGKNGTKAAAKSADKAPRKLNILNFFVKDKMATEKVSFKEATALWKEMTDEEKAEYKTENKDKLDALNEERMSGVSSKDTSDSSKETESDAGSSTEKPKGKKSKTTAKTDNATTNNTQVPAKGKKNKKLSEESVGETPDTPTEKPTKGKKTTKKNAEEPTEEPAEESTDEPAPAKKDKKTTKKDTKDKSDNADKEPKLMALAAKFIEMVKEDDTVKPAALKKITKAVTVLNSEMIEEFGSEDCVDPIAFTEVLLESLTVQKLIKNVQSVYDRYEADVHAEAGAVDVDSTEDADAATEILGGDDDVDADADAETPEDDAQDVDADAEDDTPEDDAEDDAEDADYE